MVRTLIQRADSIPSNKEEKRAEIAHVKRALAANEYRSWVFKMPEKGNREVPSERMTPSNRTTPVALPYIQGLSENLRRIFKTYNITSYHKPINTLRSQLVRPKDTTPIQNQCGVVYRIQCPECQQDYVGETGRNMGTRPYQIWSKLSDLSQTFPKVVSSVQSNTCEISGQLKKSLRRFTSNI